MNRDISPWKMSSTTLNDRGNNEEKAARFELLLRSHSIVIEDDITARAITKIVFKKTNIN